MVWASAPRPRRWTAAFSRSGEGRPASHTVRVRRAIRRRAVASAISDVPPRISRDWGVPKASFMTAPGCGDRGFGGLPPVCGRSAAEVQPVVAGVSTGPGGGPGPTRRPRQGPAPAAARGIRAVGGTSRPAGRAAAGRPSPGRRGRRRPRPPRRAVQEGAEAGQAGRDVQGEGPAGHREGQPAGVALAEPLQDGEERGAAAGRDPVHDPAQGLLMAVPDDELVLHEAGPAVDPVPVRDPVEGVEEGGDPLQFAGAAVGGPAIPELVEQAHGGTADEAFRDEGGGGRESVGPEFQRTGERVSPECVPT